MRLAADCAVPRARPISCVPRLHWVFQAHFRHKTPPTGAGTPQADQTWVCYAGGTAWSFWQPVLRPFISATVSNCYDGNFFDCLPLGLCSDAYWSLVVHLATKTLQPTSTPQRHGPHSPPPTLTSLNLAEVNPHFPILGNVQWVQL